MKVFNHEMYNKYYPCQTELDVECFVLDFGWDNIYKQIRIDEEDKHFAMESLIKEYSQRCKKETDCFGNVKENVVEKNRILKKELDLKINAVKNSLLLTQRMIQEVVIEGKLSIDAANYILKRVNYARHNVWVCIIILMIVFAVVLFLL